MSEVAKRHSNIYSMFNNNDQVITSLLGGGGWSCSQSNYCHVQRENHYKDRDTGDPNPIYQQKSRLSKYSG